jgi:hypothetical protein
MEYTTDRLQIELQVLKMNNEQLIQTCKTLLETYVVYRFDLYCGAIINRTLNLTKGFISQIQDDNFLAAAPLVRLNIDSLLRLYAAFQVDSNIDEFASKIMKGESLRKLKDKQGMKMTDQHLVEQLSKEKGYEWVTTIYNTGNEYVHFTSQHIFASIKVDNSTTPSKLQGIMQYGDSFIELKEKIWATKAMSQIIEGLNDFELPIFNSRLNLNKSINNLNKTAICIWINLAKWEDLPFLRFILLCDSIEMDVNSKGTDGIGAFQELLTNRNFQKKLSVIKWLLIRGYKLTIEDEIYFNSFYDPNGNSKDIWHTIEICNDLTDRQFVDLVFEYYKPLFILKSIKQKKIVGFNFRENDWLSFANNAIHYYSGYWRYFESAFKSYDLWNVLLKLDKHGTFQNKLKEFENNNQLQNHNLDEVILDLYPEICYF